MAIIDRVPPIDMTLQIVQTARAPEFTASRDTVVSRELGLHKATAGMFTARRIKASGHWPLEDLVSADLARLTMVYVLAGFIRIRAPEGILTLRPHDAISQIPLTLANVVDTSQELELLELRASDTPRVRVYLPNFPEPMISIDAPELHAKGHGPRDFFDYRDVGLADITDRRMDIQVIRAQRARQGGTGWHSHTMAQLSYGLSGWASLGIEGEGKAAIQAPGDAFCIPAGCVHNADSFSHDYWALQVQIPADYDTHAHRAPAALGG